MTRLNHRRLCVAIVFLSFGMVFATDRVVDRSSENGKTAKGADAVEFESPKYSPGLARISDRIRGTTRTTTSDHAVALLNLAGKQTNDAALATLQQIIRTPLASTARNDAIRAEAYLRLAGFYEDRPSRKIVHLAMALQFEASSERRAQIEKQIIEAGGDPMIAAFRPRAGTATPRRDPGSDDSCLGSVPVAVPHAEIMNITPAGDHNWRSFDIGPDAWAMRIETISDHPGTGEDDTNLTLWSDCPENGGVILAFNEDTPDDFTSRIETECMTPGTYYVEVGGFFDEATPENFALEIEITDICQIPEIDSFEPDDERATAGSIGHPTSTPSGAHGWGRSKKEIQARSLFPPGDVDNARIALTRNEYVRLGTAGRFPTFFNGFDGSESDENPDTILTLLYENDAFLGGRCNQQDNGFLPICLSDDDCPDPLDNPIPGYPPCIFLGMFPSPTPSGRINLPLVSNDDRSVTDPGSEINVCLPRTTGNTPSLTLQKVGGGFVGEVTAHGSSNAFGSIFSYEIQARNEVACLFEHEPNNTFEEADPIAPGTIAGFYDFVATNPYADADLYRFDVAESTPLRFETHAPEVFQSDTAFELYVGPDDSGVYYDSGISSEDDGLGFLSLIEVILPPASDLLGNTTADADYYLSITSNYFNPNFYYELEMTVIEPPAVEAEPNDSLAMANVLEVGQRIFAGIDTGCDVDVYRFDLLQETFVTLRAPAGGDSAIELVTCDAPSNVLICDDDSDGSMRPRIEGCLPPGSYCARVRAFSPADTFSYELELNGTTGCMATDPPVLSGDRSFTCLDFDSCP